MPLTAGTLLGPYEVAAQIGAGGMGEVYRAHDTRLGRDVAVKVLPEELSADPKFKQRFEREAKTISQLQHPNVCTLHDVGEQDGVDYLVMEYLEGETLEDRLREGALPVEETLRIGSEIASAVDAAHERGIVHRDLKPGNVMLTKAGAKVLDFGLAREGASSGEAVETQAATAQAITAEGTLLGTMPYMAPELLEGKPASERSDVWALGCILYEMATGERPFGGSTQASLIAAIMEREPEPPSQRQPLAPKRLDRVAKQCLEKNAEKRWQSARDVGIQLGAIRQGGNSSSTGTPGCASDTASSQPGVGTQAARHRQIRPIVVLVGLAVAVLVAVWWFGERNGDLEETDAAASGALDPAVVHGGSATPAREPRMAILRFENLSGSPELDQVAIGVSEEFQALDPGWRVAARRKVGPSDAEACDVAADLDSEFVLRGSLRRATDRLLVSARLHDCFPEIEFLWAKTYDIGIADLLQAQKQVAAALFADTQQVANFDGFYENPQSARWYIGRRTRVDNEKALAMMRASGHPSIVEAWLQALVEGWADPPSGIVGEMTAAADACLVDSARTWVCQFLAGYSHFFRGHRDDAIVAMRRSLKLSGAVPVPLTQGVLGLFLATAGQSDEAIEILEPLIESNPEDPMAGQWLTYLALAHFAAERYSEAREYSIKAIDLNADDPWGPLATAWQTRAASEAHLRDLESAQASLAKALDLRPALTSEWVGVIYATADPELRQRYLAGLRQAGLKD